MRPVKKKLQDKRGDFNFLLVNFLFIPTTAAYVYSRACGSYHDFLAANKKATELRIPIGKVEVESFTVATMTWLIVIEYSCHKLNYHR